MAEKTTSTKAKKQQSTAAAARSPEKQPSKGKEIAPATGSTEPQALTRQSPRKHAVHPVVMDQPLSKRVKTHDTAETASVGAAHPYAFVEDDNIADTENEGDPTY